ncbi:hypothetical protein DFJ73DRAFT_320995 [Zopfochytrium polystomum]|nr:hypothetical protein DFJ73DRAFT_320995 [Zopfochytrium polystomum]
MAVDEINQSDEILPSFRVNVVRLDGEDVMRKGGALGALALYNFLAEKLFSMATSWNSRILTQIASNNNIAVCLTSLEMVTDYIAGDLCRTCIGTVPDSKTLFTNIVTYLKSIKVRRVVMLYQDSFYKTGREGLREQLNAFKIRIDADYPVPDTLTASSRHQIVQYLLSVNARYILCIMSPDPLADLYFFSRKYDLVSPRNVWISIVPPIPESKSLSELYGDGAEEDLQGFVYVHQESQVSTSPAVRAYVDEYLGRSRLEPTRYVTAIDGPPVFSENAYDCIKMLLYGFDRLSRQGNASIQDLVSTGDPLVRATDVFSDPGFDGVTQKTAASRQEWAYPSEYHLLQYQRLHNVRFTSGQRPSLWWCGVRPRITV